MHRPKSPLKMARGDKRPAIASCPLKCRLFAIRSQISIALSYQLTKLFLRHRFLSISYKDYILIYDFERYRYLLLYRSKNKANTVAVATSTWFQSCGTFQVMHTMMASGFQHSLCQLSHILERGLLVKSLYHFINSFVITFKNFGSRH
jgi:hypothetical protein